MNILIQTCLILFFGRIIDVSLGTMKTVLTIKEKIWPAAACGFFEVFLWFMVVRGALNSDLPSLVLAVAYASGYAAGTLVGGFLSKRLISGRVTLEIITSDRSDALPKALRDAGYVLTVLNVNESGYGQPKFLILADVDKRRVGIFKKRVLELDPKAFVLLRDTKGFVGGFQARPGK